MARDTRVQDDADRAAENESRSWDVFEAGRRSGREYQANRRQAVEQSEVLMNCIECGEEIPRERQLAVPHTRRCIGCATAVER